MPLLSVLRVAATHHDPGRPTVIAAATASLVTLAILGATRLIGRRVPARAPLAANTPTEQLLTRADILDAIAAHRDTVKSGQRTLHAVRSQRERRDRRTG